MLPSPERPLMPVRPSLTLDPAKGKAASAISHGLAAYSQMTNLG